MPASLPDMLVLTPTFPGGHRSERLDVNPVLMFP
jgi:hypothetical protein